MARITQEDVLVIGRELGYTDEDVATVIERAGSPAVAHRRLTAKLRTQRAFVERKHDERIAEEDAKHARARHAKRHDGAQVERAASRLAMTLTDRLGAILADAATLPGLGTGSAVGGSGAAKKTSQIPPAARNEVIDFYLPRLVALVGNFEREVDAEKLGSGLVAEKSEDRDLRIVRDYEGWEPHEVATFDRSVASAPMVERARRKHGRYAATGQRPNEVVA